MSGGAKKRAQELDENPHIGDCKIAIEAYRNGETNKKESSSKAREVFSLIGAVLLRTGWTDEFSILKEAPLVVKVE